MGYSKSNMGRPIQGISQQPHKNRRQGQCTDQVNLRPDTVQGLITRQGSERQAVLPIELQEHYLIKELKETETLPEAFMVITGDVGDPIKLYDLQGQEISIPYFEPEISEYLEVSNPREELITLSSDAGEYIANRNITVNKGNNVYEAPNETALVYVRFIDYDTNYKIWVDDLLVCDYQSVASDAVDAKNLIGTNNVALQIHTQVLANLPTGYSVSDVHNNTFWIEKIEAPFTFEINSLDNADDDNLIIIKHEVDGEDKLPKFAPEGYNVRVRQTDTEDYEKLAYNLVADPSTNGEVIWIEGRKFDTKYELVDTPLLLTREDSISLIRFDIEARTAGDDDNNPYPTFIDNKITCLGLFQDRLIIGAGKHLCFSRSGEHEHFFKETVHKTLDGDTISLFADTTDRVTIHDVLPFDGDLIIFSDETQFMISGSQPLKPSNAALRRATDFTADINVAPVASGETVFFATPHGISSGVREFYSDSVVDTKRARPITDYVKTLIPSGIRWFKTSTSFNTLFINSPTTSNIIYVYDWLWQGSEKVQGAWSKWQFKEGVVIHYAYTRGSEFRFLQTFEGITTYHIINLDEPVDDVTGYSICIDDKKLMNFTYNLPYQRWEADNPYLYSDTDTLRGCKSTGCYEADIGTDTILFVEGGMIYTEEDLGEGESAYLVVGDSIEQVFEPTNPFPRDSQGNARGDLDKLTVSSLYFTYEQSGEVRGTVDTRAGASYTKSQSPRKMGASQNIIGFSQSVSGLFKFSIRQRAENFRFKLTTDDIQPLQIRDMSYDGNYNPRGRNI